MKTIFFSLQPPSGSYGGGSFFVKDLANYFSDKDYEITFELKPNIDLIFIIDPRQGSYKKYSLDHFLQYKQNFPNTKMLYAVNECDIKRQISINIEPLIVKCILNCDLIVFISNWIKDYYFKKYNDIKEKFDNNFQVINNACDLKVFYPLKNKSFNNTKKKN